MKINIAGIKILFGLVLLLSIGELAAQRRGTVALSPEQLDEAIDQIQRHYEQYEFAQAHALLDKLSEQLRRSKQTPSERLINLTKRIERAERLLPNTERLQLQSKDVVRIEDLDSVLAHRMGGNVVRVRQTREANGQLAGIYISEFGTWGLSAQTWRTQSLDIVREDLVVAAGEGEDIEIQSLDSAINSHEDENFPYVMPDGITLLFARQAANGLGGYDLYFSRYHEGRGGYLEPSALGMPFNSPANDYILLYDDRRKVSMLVSDRDCAEGEVALFEFAGMPRALARSVESSAERELSPEEAIHYARIQQEPTPREASDVIEQANTAIEAQYYALFGVRRLTHTHSVALAHEAMALYTERELLRERQKQVRHSYRRSPESRPELTPILQNLEQTIEDMDARFDKLVRSIRSVEAGATVD